MDRREAIRKAISLAQTLHSAPFPEGAESGARDKNGMVVLITGKGTDPVICHANGKKEPWSDAATAREILSLEALR